MGRSPSLRPTRFIRQVLGHLEMHSETYTVIPVVRIGNACVCVGRMCPGPMLPMGVREQLCSLNEENEDMLLLGMC